MPVTVTNTTAETIPPGAALEPVSLLDLDGNVTVRKPTRSDALFLYVNGHTPILAGKTGQGHLVWGDRLTLGLDPADCDADGVYLGSARTFGALAGSWYFKPGRLGFVATGKAFMGLMPALPDTQANGKPSPADPNAPAKALGTPCITLTRDSYGVITNVELSQTMVKTNGDTYCEQIQPCAPCPSVTYTVLVQTNDSTPVPRANRSVTIGSVNKLTNSAGIATFASVPVGPVTVTLAPDSTETSAWGTQPAPTASGTGFVATGTVSATLTPNQATFTLAGSVVVAALVGTDGTAELMVDALKGGFALAGRSVTCEGVTLVTNSAGRVIFTVATTSTPASKTVTCATPGGESCTWSIAGGGSGSGFTAGVFMSTGFNAGMQFAIT